jgi:tRNA pseudouridine38-40 synthase
LGAFSLGGKHYSNYTDDVSVRLKIECAYLGTRYSGWAKQSHRITIQGEIERALATVLHASLAEVATVVAGRTDAGVHAMGQVAHADLADSITLSPAALSSLAKRVNGALGTDEITVYSIALAPEGFDARFSALSRHYEYRLADRPAHKNPLKKDITAVSPYALQPQAMNDAADALLGLHDFRAFCRPRAGATTIRTLQSFSWRREADGVLVAQLSADAFCHSMVRSLVGACVAVGRGVLSIPDLIAARDRGERTSLWVTMPAKGLTLCSVTYPPEETLAARAEQTRASREKPRD